jgi:hypothetical protein
MDPGRYKALRGAAHAASGVVARVGCGGRPGNARGASLPGTEGRRSDATDRPKRGALVLQDDI